MSPSPTSDTEKPAGKAAADGEITVEGEEREELSDLTVADTAPEAKKDTESAETVAVPAETAVLPAETAQASSEPPTAPATPVSEPATAEAAELQAELSEAAKLQAETDAEADPASEKPATETPVGGEVTDEDAVTDVDATDDDDAEEADDSDAGYIDEDFPDPDRHATVIPLVGTLLALAAIAALLVGAFAWPGSSSTPRKLPIGVAGTTAITTSLENLFTQGGSHTFEVHKYSSDATLRKAIEHREVYGGLSVSGTGTANMFVATAASPTAADALNSIAQGLSQQSSSDIPVTDIVPMPSKDPRGQGLASTELPLVLVAVAPAVGLILLYRRRKGAQTVAGIGASVAVALALTLVFNYVSGSTSGSNYWFVAAGLALGVLATTLFLLGLNAVAGRIGLAIGSALLVLVAAPLSGLSTAPEWLPDPWGKIGQLLPSGANATMLRSTAFFHGHGGGQALLVLIVWAVIGLGLIGLGTVLLKNRPTEPAEAL
jgi:hypothetical protein